MKPIQRLIPVLVLAGLILAACSPTAPVAGPAATEPSAPSATPEPTALPTWTPVPVTQPGGIYVDTATAIGEVSPYVLATNFGPLYSVPAQFLPQVETAGLKLIRFPGGAWGDQNNLQEYQIDQMVGQARAWGAVPLISVRLPGGSPEQAAALVRYANVEKGYGVRYWSIGNEPNLFERDMVITQNNGVYDTVKFNQEWRAMAEAMQAVDPAILLVGPDTSQFTANLSSNAKDKNGLDWVEEFLKVNGDLVDVVAVHRYPFPSDGVNPATREQLLANSAEWDQIVPALRQVIRDTIGRDLPVAFMEVNSHWSGGMVSLDASPDSFISALWYADVVARNIRQGTEILAHFVLGAFRGGLGMFGPNDIRPVYHVFEMFQKFGTTRVPASVDNPQVTAVAAVRSDGTLTLVLINRSEQELRIPLFVQPEAKQRLAEYWLFDADHPAEAQGSLSLANGDELVLPPLSMNLYVMPKP
jgi:hypothetical protein